MKIKTVEYSRLFSIPDYQNEKISFVADLEEGENPAEVLLKLYNMAQNYHTFFSAFRKLISEMNSIQKDILRYNNYIDEYTEELIELEKEKEEWDKKIEAWKRGEIELEETVIRRGVCEIKSLKDRIDERKRSIEHYKDAIKNLKARMQQVKMAYEKLKEDIKNKRYEKYVDTLLKEKVDYESVNEIIRLVLQTP